MKIRTKRAQGLGLLLVVALLMLGTAHSLTAEAKGSDRVYEYTTIDVPGAASTVAMGNNARGDVVGYYMTAGQWHGFLLSRGELTTLDYPGDGVAWTQANAIGPAGDIVGIYSLKSPAPTGNVHGFLLSRSGEWSTLDFPEEGHLMAGGPYGILPDGTIVGCVHDGLPMTAMYGHIMGPKGTERFDYPEEKPWAMHYGATPDGKTIVGTYLAGAASPGNWHGYLLEDGNVVSFDVPDKNGTQALGISPAREVVGIYRELVGAAWLAHGYVAVTRGSVDPADWNFIEVDVPDAAQTIVRGMNAGGALVGYYIDGTGTHGFTATSK